MTVLSALKGTLLFCFFLAVFYFTYQGFDQVLEKQTSTRTEYKFGDDDNGYLEPFDVTICIHKQLAFLFQVAKGYNLSTLLENSKPKINLTDIAQRISLDHNIGSNLTFNNLTTTTRPRDENHTWIPVWTHVLDWERGHCFTFSPSAQGIYNIPITASNVYDGGQFQQFLFYGTLVRYFCLKGYLIEPCFKDFYNLL